MVGRRTPVPIDELRAVLAHVRALDVRTQRRTARTQVAAYAAFAVILAGSLRAAAPHAYLSSSPQPIEESRMRTLQNLGVVSSIALTASAATAQNAVQWRVEDGGNGHWYECRFWVGSATIPTINSWFVANQGAHLATIRDSSEDNFVWSQVNLPTVDHPYRWAILGAFQSGSASDFAEPSGGWRWVTDEPFDTTRWCAGFPDDVHSPDSSLQYPNQQCWNDADTVDVPTNHRYRVIVEWSADCNSDGIVDYGQIRAGELADTNANNIPDCCESAPGCDPCRADIDQSGAVNGVDLAAILNNWGTSGGKQPRSDVNADGIVDGADLAEVLNSWGTCP
jgi:hypothetical protein